MDERVINGAAIEAVKDLEVECEIKDVCRSGDEWCIEFSGKYGHFCDEFKNQFGEENSSQLIREKIKSHLIKQVNKIRSSTGRRRKPMVGDAGESGEAGSDLLTAPLQMIGEMFGRATGIAGEVIGQAAAVAETAREAVADAAANIAPVTIEVRSTTRKVKKKAPASTKRKTVKAAKATPAKAKKATKRVARRAGKQAKKAGKAARKTAGRTQKAVKKASRKGARRRSG